MKSTIDPETKKLIDKSIEKAIKKATSAIIEANKKTEAEQRNYFKDTEKLLYSLPALKLKVDQDEEDIKNGVAIRTRKSPDVIKFGGGQSCFDEDEYIERRKASMERTKREIQRIERALETIQDDEYYPILPLKYWDELSAVEIAERLGCEERTFYRHKNRLISKLKVVLFGADAL